jgi:hypothetical protein
MPFEAEMRIWKRLRQDERYPYWAAIVIFDVVCVRVYVRVFSSMYSIYTVQKYWGFISPHAAGARGRACHHFRTTLREI